MKSVSPVLNVENDKEQLKHFAAVVLLNVNGYYDPLRQLIDGGETVSP